MEQGMKKITSTFVLALLLGVFFVIPSPVSAKEQKTGISKIKERSAQNKCDNISLAKVTEVHNANPKAKESNSAGLGDQIIITVECLPHLVEDSANKKQKIVLFLDGMPIKKVDPEVIDTINNTLRFRLKRTEDSKAAWDSLLGSPDRLTRNVLASVGLENESFISTTADKFNLIIIRKGGFLFWIIISLLILLALIFLARKKSILRNYGPQSPYSLALVQMAFWLVLIFIAFIFLRLITGVMPDISGSSLTLLGIGAGTALGARIIDENKLSSRLSSLRAEKEKIEKQLNEAKSTNIVQANIQELEKSYVDITKNISTINSVDTKVNSNGFFTDILNDVNGMSLHRFQIVIWTLILGIIFVCSVYQELSMPEFSDTLLALVGISSGTYLGFKFPEQHKLS
ncbi:MAG: hypothetical protein WC855_06020 [Thermodesulfovibrionales bacterium]